MRLSDIVWDCCAVGETCEREFERLSVAEILVRASELVTFVDKVRGDTDNVEPVRERLALPVGEGVRPEAEALQDGAGDCVSVKDCVLGAADAVILRVERVPVYFDIDQLLLGDQDEAPVSVTLTVPDSLRGGEEDVVALTEATADGDLTIGRTAL